MDIIGAVIDVAQAKYDEPAGQMRVIVESQLRPSSDPDQHPGGVIGSTATLFSNGLSCVKADGDSPAEAIRALGQKVLDQGEASVASLKDKLATLRGLVTELVHE